MPNTPKLVDVSKLQENAVIYDKTLRTLPFLSLKEIAANLKLNVMDLQGEHSLIHERRRAGGTQSYKVGKNMDYFRKLLGYEPSKIKPRDVVFVTRENSKKYDDNELLVVGGKAVDNKSKKNPLEQRILFNLVKSHTEDIATSLFTAERDDDSSSPAGCMDGFFTHLDMLLATGDVNAARGNFANSGAFMMPTSETDYSAYENLVEWIGTSHPFLRKKEYGIPQLLCAETVLIAVRAALRNKLRLHDYPTMERTLEMLREDAMCPKLVIDTDTSLGNGSRLILQKVGNMDVAFNTQSSNKFVQVRDIYEDPNEWQFWLQAGYDTRIRDWHEKVFRTNEQTNSSLDLSGDYCKVGAVQISIDGAPDGKWKIQGRGSLRSNGQWVLGLPPGDYIVEFEPVAGKTEPSNITVTVREGEVTTASGTYS